MDLVMHAGWNGQVGKTLPLMGDSLINGEMGSTDVA